MTKDIVWRPIDEPPDVTDPFMASVAMATVDELFEALRNELRDDHLRELADLITAHLRSSGEARR